MVNPRLGGRQKLLTSQEKRKHLDPLEFYRVRPLFKEIVRPSPSPLFTNFSDTLEQHCKDFQPPQNDQPLAITETNPKIEF